MEGTETDINKCEICNITWSGKQSKLDHLLGKKHQLALHREHMSQTKEKCGIFISGFPNLISEEEILSCFSSFGKITDFFFPSDKRFLIVQYDSPDSVQEALKTGANIRGRKLNVKQRVLKDKGNGRGEFVKPIENFEQINDHIKKFTEFQTQVVMLIREVQPNWLDMVVKYRALCRDLQNILQESFPGCVVHPFGSTVTGLGFSTSDVDIYVQVPSSANATHVSYASIRVNKSRHLLLKYGNIFSQVLAIPRAKTPIVKCVHNPTGISCDFNFKNMLGVCNSNLIRYYLSLHEKLRSVMIVIKYWAKVHDLSGGSGKFSNYSLIMLLIFYLQQEPYLLPPVIALQPAHCVNLQEGWNGGFEPIKNFASTPLTTDDVQKLLLGFFNYYTSFDFTLFVICPYLGRVMLKTDFLKAENLPDEFKLYKTTINDSLLLRVDTAVCIQDPFEQAHNISSSVPARHLEEFVAFCKLGVEIFNTCPVDLHKLMVDEVECIDYKKYIIDDSRCVFKIPMGSHLLYLNQEVTKENDNVLDVEEKQNRIKKAWHLAVNQFIMIALRQIMKFDLKLQNSLPDNKSQKLVGQSDVHDTNLVDMVSFHCTGIYNFWDVRKSITKDLIDDSLNFLDKQIFVSDYIRNVLYNGILLTNNILELEVTLLASNNPTEMAVQIKDIHSKRGQFKAFAVFFAKTMPGWFDKYISELDKSVQCNSVESEANPPEKEKEQS